MKLTLRHAWIHSLMILILLAATFFSGLHHHAAEDNDAMEQSCEFCLSIKQAVGILPSLPGGFITGLLAYHAAPLIVFVSISLPFFLLARPRGPPIIPC